MAMAWNGVAGKRVPGLGIDFEGREGSMMMEFGDEKKRTELRMSPMCLV